MNTKTEALEIVARAAPEPTEVVEVPLGEALHRVLAADVTSDMDMPPFEKSSMDGWAVRSQDAKASGARLSVRGRIMAGSVPPAPVGPGETMKVMTGAPIPEGADSVVVVEQSLEDPDDDAVTLTAAARPGANVCHRGEDVRAGETVLSRGTWLDAPALSVLGMVGADPVPTFRLPTVAVIPTGDELVEAGGPVPGPGMIRESNGPLIAAQVSEVSSALRPVRPGIARDDAESLGALLDVALDHDVLCLTGGVSMGDLDIVGRILRERGMEVLVEKVSIKPGKPLVFGRVARVDGHVCHVFALPGNPVSAYVTFELFVRPFLLAAMGRDDVRPDEVDARYAGKRRLRSIPRTQHVPALVESTRDGLVATPLEWHGSADLRALADANGLAIVGAGRSAPEPGDRVRVHLLPGRPLRARRRPSRPGAGS